MNIAMTGATGYIGKHLSNYLTEKGGHRIIPLGRAMFREGMSGLLVQTLTHCDVIINLAGAPINQRWTPEHKQELFNSRITVTHRIIRALNAVKTKPKLMISASAVGYYPSLVESDEYTQTLCGDGLSLFRCRAFPMEGDMRPLRSWRLVARIFVMRNVVRNRPGLSLPASVSCFLPMEERCNKCSARCVQQRLPPS